MSASQREPLPDALRALALVGVLSVNAAGYHSAPYGSLLGTIEPDGSSLAWMVQIFQATLLQGKAYPVLAFLFGWSLMAQARRARSDRSETGAVTRLRRLLLLGVLHGLLLYFGDILTLYALAGLLLLSQTRVRASILKRRMAAAAVASALVTASSLALLAFFSAMPVQETPQDQTLGGVQRLLDFWAVNGLAYAGFTLAGVFAFLPVLCLCMLGGIWAQRLKWLTHRRWQPQRRWMLRVVLPGMLLVNLGYGWAMAQATAGEDRAWWVEAVAPLVGLPLAGCYLAWAGESWLAGRRRWVTWLAPLGRRTLSVYVGHALWSLLLFSGLGLAWQPGTAGKLLMSLLLWLALVAAARNARSRWPLEAWMGRQP